MSSEREDLLTLARLYGVQTSYHDVWGNYVEASPESLLGVLRALEAPVEGLGDVPEALEARREELASRIVEPVVVAWDGHVHAGIELRLGALGADIRGPLACHLDLEGGERRGWVLDLESLPETREGVRSLTLPEPLPTGYHELRIEAGGRAEETLILSAPSRAWTEERPLWGVFLPLYALHTARSWGAGDFSDLETLAEWTAGLGGGVVATLPMLAAFLDEPCEPSPYAPASRLFWNELYLDPRRLPEIEESTAARRLLESADFQRETETLRAAQRVDYPRLDGPQAAGARGARPPLLRPAFGPAGGARAASAKEAGARDLCRVPRGRGPPGRDLAALAGAAARRHARSRRLRRGRPPLLPLDPVGLRPADARHGEGGAAPRAGALPRPAARRARQLLRRLARTQPLRPGGLGSSGGGAAGLVLHQGAELGLPAASPRTAARARLQASRSPCLRHHLEHAGLLRIDHVMQLQRLFWIPQGMEARDGAYVTYPAEELCAVLSLESHRHKAMIVGENLGTVPPRGQRGHGPPRGPRHVRGAVRAAAGGQGLRQPPARSAASLNTHDMPTFRAFWEGRDVEDLESLGFFDAEQARNERNRRAEIRASMENELPPESRGDAEAIWRNVLLLLLERLAASPARMVLINLEDLWGEAEPQNIPGTHTERPNWRRKARLSFEEFSTDPRVVDTLRRVDELRRG